MIVCPAERVWLILIERLAAAAFAIRGFTAGPVIVMTGGAPWKVSSSSQVEAALFTVPELDATDARVISTGVAAVLLYTLGSTAVSCTVTPSMKPRASAHSEVN